MLDDVTAVGMVSSLVIAVVVIEASFPDHVGGDGVVGVDGDAPVGKT